MSTLRRLKEATLAGIRKITCAVVYLVSIVTGVSAFFLGFLLFFADEGKKLSELYFVFSSFVLCVLTVAAILLLLLSERLERRWAGKM